LENLYLQGAGDFTAGGNSLDNYIEGNSGNNVLAGGLGADTLVGGLGNDTYVLSDNEDTIVDVGGIDAIRSILDIKLFEGIENAELVGISNVTATGTFEDNILIGNLGHNTLEGGLGVDTLTGGLGGDSFVMSYNGEGIAADKITDFTPGEDLLIIDLGSFDIDVAALGLSGSGLVAEESFVGAPGVQALDGNDHFLFDTAQGVFFFDPDGNGEAAKYAVAHIILDDESARLQSSDVFVGV